MAKPLNQSPRISANKLAEFMEAGALRQRQILRDQKYPTDFKGPYYKEAAIAISRCIASDLVYITALDAAIDILEQMSPTKIGTRRRIDANIDAIETFKLMLDDIDLQGATPNLGANSAERLVIEGVEISVRPEILLSARGKKGDQLVGAIKLHFPRTYSLNDAAGGYVSAIIQEWAKSTLYDAGTAFGPLCYVIDVGAKRVCPGVKSTVTRLREITAQCQNIAALWPTIKASDGS